MASFEKGPSAPDTKTDYTRQNEEKRQRALGRAYAITHGKVREFDETMREIDTGGASQNETGEARRDKYHKGTVDKDVLAEAARRKMFAGGDRPLTEFIADVMKEREPQQKGTGGFVPDQEKKAM